MDHMLTTERQGDQDLQAAADAGGHIIAWADDWEVSGVQEEQYEITVPTVADRIAQTVVALRLEARAESIFHPDSSAVGLRGLRAGCATSSVGVGWGEEGHGGFGFRLSQRGALRGSMGQAASDGVDGDAFVRGIGAAGPVEGRHPCAACVVQADQSPFVVGNRAAGAAALGR
jgi:hypothetical protein